MKGIVLIGIVKNHHILYQYLINILLENFDEVCFITKKEIIRNIKIKNKFLRLIIDDSKKEDTVYKKYLSIINGYEVLISDEYYSPFYRLRKVVFKNKIKYLIIHNGNKWSGSIYNPISNLKYFLDQFFRPTLLNQFNRIITISPTVQNFLKNKLKNKSVYFIPFNFSKELIDPIKKTSKIKIVVPGLVSSKRRDYISLLKQIKIHYRKVSNSNIIFSFLGKLDVEKETNIFEMIQDINKKYGQKILFWEKFIDQEEYFQNIIHSDLLLSNTQMIINKQGFYEEYGYSKESE